MTMAAAQAVQVSERRFKENLIDVWPEVSCIHNQGGNDLVCSNKIEVGDALRKAHKLTVEGTEKDNEDDVNEQDAFPEESIVHKAVGILRQKIKQTQ